MSPKPLQGEGFPLSEVENILALSDPPYFTACPNPFLKDVDDTTQDESKHKTTGPHKESHEQRGNLRR